MAATPPAPLRRQFWGRSRGHKLRPSQRALLETRLPQLAVTLPAAGTVDPRALFDFSATAIWLEVGFGKGEHLAALAERHPDIGFIGCEPFVNGVAHLLALIEQRRLRNIRLFADDARLLLAALPDASLERVFVLFPDPWPKRRHRKRRIIAPAVIDRLAALLVAGGIVQLATDHAELCRWMLWHMLADGRFAWPARRPADWRDPPAEWTPTRYQAKGLAGERAYHLRFARRDPRF